MAGGRMPKFELTDLGDAGRERLNPHGAGRMEISGHVDPVRSPVPDPSVEGGGGPDPVGNRDQNRDRGNDGGRGDAEVVEKSAEPPGTRTQGPRLHQARASTLVIGATETPSRVHRASRDLRKRVDGRTRTEHG